MANTALNDISYNFEPLVLNEPDPNYKVDKEALQISIDKNRALIQRLKEKINEKKNNTMF